MNRMFWLSLCLCASLVQFGCSAGRDASLAGPAYPADKPQTSTLDIQAVRSPTTVTITNSTARAYGRSRLWLNRWYSYEIDTLAVGQTLQLPLSSFRDQNGEPFRSGGFWATRKPQRVQQVQLETADGMVGLVAVGKESD